MILATLSTQLGGKISLDGPREICSPCLVEQDRNANYRYSFRAIGPKYHPKVALYLLILVYRYIYEYILT